MNRTSLINQLLMGFSKAYTQSLEKLSIDDKLFVTEALIEFKDRVLNKEDYTLFYKEIIEEKLLKKHRSKMSFFIQCQLTDYFLQDSHKLMLLQHEINFKTETGEEQFLSDKEYIGFMDRIGKLLGFERQTLFILEEPAAKEEIQAEEVIQKIKEHTARRQTLAIFYLDMYCKLNAGKEIALARFIHFLTDKNLDNIVKVLRNPLKISDKKKVKADEELIKDLKYIRIYFEELGLNGILKLIDRDITAISK